MLARSAGHAASISMRPHAAARPTAPAAPSGLAICAAASTSAYGAAASAPAATSPASPAACAPCAALRQLHPTQRARLLRRLAPRAAAAAATDSVEEVFGASTMSAEVADIVTYAVKFCVAAQRYEVHSWMLLLGMLRFERSAACEVLQELGLEDIYGAWHEVLWALNVSDGLNPRAYTPRLRWGARAYRIANGAVRFAAWAGEDRVQSEDLLMAFAADGVLAELFPDLDLSFDRVKRAVEKHTNAVYELPGYKGASRGGPLGSQDNFL